MKQTPNEAREGRLRQLVDALILNPWIDPALKNALHDIVAEWDHQDKLSEEPLPGLEELE